jgi:hypothetical protein
MRDTADFFSSRLGQITDLRHPLTVLMPRMRAVRTRLWAAGRLFPWR